MKAKERQEEEEEEEEDQRLCINDLIENKILQKTFRRSSN
jgi:hypothetical protein